MYTSEISTSDNTTTAAFATHEDTAIDSMKLQPTINKTDAWAKKWTIKINQSKSTHITFTLRNQTCPTVQMGNVDLPQENEVKYLGMPSRQNNDMCNAHQTQKETPQPKREKMNWLLGRRSTLSIESKLLHYKAVFKPIWTFGIHLRRPASNSKIEILQLFESKTLRSILNAPCYINNHRIQ
jgi:hypothetical protein